MEATVFKDRCCNPHGLINHRKFQGLRLFSSELQKSFPNLNPDRALICATCRHIYYQNKKTRIPEENEKSYDDEHREMADERDVDQENEVVGDRESTTTQSSPSECTPPRSPESQNSPSITLPVVNRALQYMNCSPIPPKRIANHEWIVNKTKKVCTSLQKTLGVPTESSLKTQETAAGYFHEMMEQLKQKFNSELCYAKKVETLTLLPKSWSLDQIVHEMGATRYMARIAKKLIITKGICSIPERRIGKLISPEVVQKVIDFYLDDEVSSTRPGKKECVVIKNEQRQAEHIQKRLLMANLRELYQFFKEKEPNCIIGFSKFAMLRPKQCVIAGTSGTHTVCVCPIHQNIKLMILGAKLPQLTKDMDATIKSCEDIIAHVTCDVAELKCFTGNCETCPQLQLLYDALLEIFANNDVRTITYKQWISEPYTVFKDVNEQPVEDFARALCDKAKLLCKHDFLAKKQSAYLKSLKTTLSDDECIVLTDFSENYAFVIQEAAPGYHWNSNTQATIYPVVIYYKQDNKIVHKSLVIVSDCMHHDAVAVHMFSRVLNAFLEGIIPQLRKIYYFTDGAPQQYKNYKNFANVYYHFEDFGVLAEWHFFVTAHGKGPCDGTGGTFKRKAAKASLQLPPEQQITSAEALFRWASQPTTFPSIAVKFVSDSEYAPTVNELRERFQSVKRIPQTQQLHCFMPQDNGVVFTKEYSSAVEYKTHRFWKNK